MAILLSSANKNNSQHQLANYEKNIDPQFLFKRTRESRKTFQILMILKTNFFGATRSNGIKKASKQRMRVQTYNKVNGEMEKKERKRTNQIKCVSSFPIFSFHQLTKKSL
jgi:hypothetical protein